MLGYNTYPATTDEVFELVKEKYEEDKQEQEQQEQDGSGQDGNEGNEGNNAGDSGDSDGGSGSDSGQEDSGERDGSDNGSVKGGKGKSSGGSQDIGSDSDDQGDDSDSDGEGNGKGDFDLVNYVDSVDGDSGCSTLDGFKEAIEGMTDEEKQDLADLIADSDIHVHLAGNDEGHVHRDIEPGENSLAWNKVIARVFRDTGFHRYGDISGVGLEPAQNWARKNVMMGPMGDGNFRLPGFSQEPTKRNGEGTHKPTIIIAVDQSGSMGDKEVAYALGAVKALPVGFDTHAFVFDTRAFKLDPRTGQADGLMGGGTDFGAIDRYLLELVGQGVDLTHACCLVFTDGKILPSYPDDEVERTGIYNRMHFIDCVEGSDGTNMAKAITHFLDTSMFGPNMTMFSYDGNVVKQ